VHHGDLVPVFLNGILKSLNIIPGQQKAFFIGISCLSFGRDLLHDLSAKPVLSLLGFQKNLALGHILFTTAQLSGSQGSASIVILAPLAIVPDAQKQGIGGKLIEKGLELLSKSGVDLVFVLGHPEYYPRYGFKPAGDFGFEAPYPIPDVHANAWMVQALRLGVIGSVSGKVICADALNKPEHWRE
jgi:putative acetyltransferase